MKEFQQVTLTKTDYRFLMSYLANASLSAHNHSKLYSKLESARIVSPDDLPLNIVCANAKVVIWNMSKKQTFSIHLVNRSDINSSTNKVSMYDEIAVALLGYSSGAITDWEMADGIHQLKVISVYQVTDPV